MEYQKLTETLSALGYLQDAAEYHGILAGMLCWNDRVPCDLGLNEDASSRDGDLEALQQSLLASLKDAGMGFSPLLPADSAPLHVRTAALGQWCAGFMYGLASREGFKPEQASEDTCEAIKDLAAISRAASETEDEDSDEAEESAYAEILEYVRVVAQVIWLDLRAS